MDSEILEEAELAKSHLMGSNLDDRCKKSLMRLLNISTMATNGLSVEEKIQKITEAIHGLVLSQITFLDSVDKKIAKANAEKCKDCKAMRHADDMEAREEREEIIKQWKQANGISDEPAREDPAQDGWIGFFKKLVTQPAMWVFLTFLAISPYGVDIVKAILEVWAK